MRSQFPPIAIVAFVAFGTAAFAQESQDSQRLFELLQKAKATDFGLLAKKVKQAKRVRSKDFVGTKQDRVTIDPEHFVPEEDENDGRMVMVTWDVYRWRRKQSRPGMRPRGPTAASVIID